MERRFSPLWVLVLSALFFAGCAQHANVGATASASASSGGSTAASEWSTYGKTYDNQRYDPSSQITSKNITSLVPAWVFQTGVIGSFETSPLVVDGTMYITTGSNDTVIALDAATGAIKWRYIPKLGFATFCCGPVNRGVAYDKGSIFFATLDGRLIALDAVTGRERWIVTVGNPQQGFSETMAPLVADDLVYIGSSGGEYGIRGSFTAYHETDGKMAWRWWVTSPGWEGKYASTANGLSLHRDIAAEKRDTPKYRNAWQHGGGPIWQTPAFDPQRDVIYVATGNPSPQLIGPQRPGDNLYTDSIVALDAKSGTMKWYYQETPHDLWDYDAVSPTFLFNTTDGQGHTVPAVAQAGKTGWIYVLNRETGQPIRVSESVVPQKDMFATPGPNGAMMEPGALGGVNWSPASYNPTTHMAYVAAIVQPRFDKPLPYATWQPGGERWAGSRQVVRPHVPQSGVVAAVDVDTGKIAWKYDTSYPLMGGTMTAGDLVFTGEGNGMFDAFDAKGGTLLWQYQTGAGIGAPPIAYEINGREYIAVASGGNFLMNTPTGDAVFVFALPAPSTPGPHTMATLPPPITSAQGGGAPVPVSTAEVSVAQPIASGAPAPSGAPGSMKFNAADKSVTFVVDMGAPGEGSGLNFNGKFKGHLTMTVPLNWKVTMTAVNQDSLPHSLEIISAQQTPPMQGIQPPIFAGATTAD
ncbi:hypothetical protein EPN42_08055, partial [bacterium]